MQNTRLAGGSAGYHKVDENTYEGNRISMFRDPDVNPVFLSSTKQITGYILPGFNPALAEFDEARPMSVCSYRDASVVDPETDNPAFTSWFVSVPGYNFYGTGKNTFISPRAVGQPDPIFDCRMEVYRRRKQGDESLMHLVNRPTSYKDPHPLPGTVTLTMFNAVCPPTNEKERDQSVKNRILILKKAATRKLFADLDMPRPVSVTTPVDADWPTFLLGDITNPQHALYFTSATGRLDNGTEYPALDFGKVMYVDAQTSRIDCHSTQVPAQYLQGRYDLCDVTKTVYIPTYEELVELLVSEGLVPYELIEAVCADKCNKFPTKPSRTAASAPVSHTPTASPSAYAPVAVSMPTPAPAPMPAPAPVVEREFWITRNGQVESMTESQLKAAVDTGFRGAVMAKEDNSWQTLQHYNLLPTAPTPMPAPASTPQTSEQVPVTTAPMPAVAPASPTTPQEAPTGGMCRTAEQEARLKELMERVAAMNPALGPAELQEFSALRALAPYRD